MDPSKVDTQSLARNHIIEVNDDKMITIAGIKPQCHPGHMINSANQFHPRLRNA